MDGSKVLPHSDDGLVGHVDLRVGLVDGIVVALALHKKVVKPMKECAMVARALTFLYSIHRLFCSILMARLRSFLSCPDLHSV